MNCWVCGSSVGGDASIVMNVLLRPRASLEGPCHGAGQHVGLAVKGCDQTVKALGPENGGEFRAARRDFADRAVEVDVGDQPAVTGSAHCVVDLDWLSI